MITSAYIASARQTRDWNTRRGPAWPRSVLVYRAEHGCGTATQRKVHSRASASGHCSRYRRLKSGTRARARKSSRDLYPTKCRLRVAHTVASLCRLRINAQFPVMGRALRPRRRRCRRAERLTLITCCECSSIIRECKSLARISSRSKGSTKIAPSAKPHRSTLLAGAMYSCILSPERRESRKERYCARVCD